MHAIFSLINIIILINLLLVKKSNDISNINNQHFTLSLLVSIMLIVNCITMIATMIRFIKQ